jgi:hypothetical protein
MQVQRIVVYEPSNIFNISLSLKLCYDFCDFIYGGENVITIEMVYFEATLPSTIDGRNSLSLPKANLNTASLFPELVNLIVSLVDISTEDSLKKNLRLARSTSMTTGTHLAVTVISNS